MSQGYQARDAAIVDYQLWQPAPDGRWLRGPRPDQLVPGSYFACVGAAQTFGCFVARPWPTLLQQQLGLPALNLGIAGAGPALFRNDALLQLLRGARFVVYQVMSGRSADCSRFATGGHERVTLPDGRQLGAGAAWSELLQQDLRGINNPVLRGIKNRLCAAFGRKHIRRLVAETQSNWSSDFRALIKDVARPSALLWFSKRTPQHRPRYHSLEALFGEFPQLIDATMVRSLAAEADHYVECVTSRGSPQPLAVPVRPADAGTGEAADLLWSHNAYYPSPEMHEDAAKALLGVVKGLSADSD
tara:strand:+ start:14358 stop:15263 length:906 start_codon:yes stop_codon:yes gene_type:complete